MIQNPFLSALRKRLSPDEEILASATESDIKKQSLRGSIIATNKRLLLFRPSDNGTTQLFRSFHYSDIQKVLHKPGRAFSKIWITTNNGGEFFFEKLEKIEALHVADFTHEMRSKSASDLTKKSKEIAA
ncbi:MAG: PH domain-containing protein [Candidatus Hermodarchaeia archaeon]|jgi:hypothetical protein